MARHLICLANSKKYMERCIAGVALCEVASGFVAARDAGEPLWLRPVSHGAHGSVATHLVDHIKLLDIVEVPVTAPCPDKWQTENVFFDERAPLKVVRRAGNLSKAVPALLTKRGGELFGNRARVVRPEQAARLNYSLLFIKPLNLRILFNKNRQGEIQLRAKFWHNHVEYDLPITDLGFVERFMEDFLVLKNREVYLTISLGLAYAGLHYKLVAGVVYF